MSNDQYKTSFERSLEFGLHAKDLRMSIPIYSRPGNVIVDEDVPLLINNVDESKGQLSPIRKRRIQTKGFILSHILACQLFQKRGSLDEMAKEGTLYEILSIWNPIPSEPFYLPNFELSACVNNWHLNGLEPERGKQPYDPGKMTLNTLMALQLHGKLDLPKHKRAEYIDLDY